MTYIGFEYVWLYPTGIFKKDFTVTQDLAHFRKSLPFKVDEIIKNGVEEKLITKCTQVHYYILNLNASHLKNQFLVDRNQKSIRLNFAPHAFLIPNAKQGQEFKLNVLSAIYTSNEKLYVHSGLRGIEEC